MKNFEAPERLSELKIPETLSRIGLKEGDVFCDFGAGTGIFSFEACGKHGVTVFAVEKDPDMLEILKSKKEKQNAAHVHILDDIEQVKKASCDVLLMCTVLHEILDQPALLSRVADSIKPEGIAAVIEFHKRQTPFGPPAGHRMERSTAVGTMQTLGFALQKEWDLGENLYCIVFQKK